MLIAEHGKTAIAKPQPTRKHAARANFCDDSLCYHRRMPLAPTVLGINLWLVVQVVPLVLAQAVQSRLLFALTPWPPLLLLIALRLRHRLLWQVLLLVGFPVLLALTEALNPAPIERLNPTLAVLIKLGLFLLYLASTCNLLAKDSPGRAQSASWQKAWEVRATGEPPPSQKIRRRTATHFILLALCIALPSLFFYAICLHPPHVRQLLRWLGSVPKVAALQATLLAATAMLWASLFYFGVMRPLKLHIGYDSSLRLSISQLRQAARRGRPRPQLYVAMAVALVGMAALLFLSW